MDVWKKVPMLGVFLEPGGSLGGRGRSAQDRDVFGKLAKAPLDLGKREGCLDECREFEEMDFLRKFGGKIGGFGLIERSHDFAECLEAMLHPPPPVCHELST